TQQGCDGTFGTRDELGTKLQDPTFDRVFLHDLDALAGGDQFPFAIDGVGVELTQGVDFLAVGFGDLRDQVANQVEVVFGHVEHGAQVVWANRFWQVQEGPGFQKVRGEPGVGTKHQRAASVNKAGVQVRHGHGWGADGGLTID
ncbi:hypothetical protein PY38_00160, partial [Staphylococcus aureus]